MNETHMEKVYSTNEEIYSYSDLDECVTNFIDEISEEDFKVGYIFSVYEGVSSHYKASDFAPSYICEGMGERADDECHEDYAGEWPDASKEQELELLVEVKKLIDGWADKHDLHPKFYRVRDTGEISIKITNIPTGEPSAYEIGWEVIAALEDNQQ